jgi:hypothetical protein
LSKKSKGYFVISQIGSQQQLKSAAASLAGSRWQTQLAVLPALPLCHQTTRTPSLS